MGKEVLAPNSKTWAMKSGKILFDHPSSKTEGEPYVTPEHQN